MTGKWLWISICMLLTVLLCACSADYTQEKKIRDLDFTVVNPDDISEELKQHIEERKNDPFTLIYKDGENMYLIIGYGEQSTGGYSIKVKSLYVGKTSIYVCTLLEGPADAKDESQAVSFPYIVLKLEMMDYPVVFDI